MNPPTIAVIGSGRAAKAIAAAARRAGVGRRPVDRAAIVVVAVADRAIEEVARGLADARPAAWRGRVALHLSGARGVEALAPLRTAGALAGVLHPLTVFGASSSPPPFAFRLEGPEAFRRAARRLAVRLWPGARELRPARALDDAGRALYHAAASIVANDLVALLDGGTSLFDRIGIPRRAGEPAIARLAGDALFAAGSKGLGSGATGPVVRGDVDTVRRHLSALRRLDPELAEVHRLLSLRLVRIALEAGRISAAQGADLRRVLGGPRPRRGV